MTFDDFLAAASFKPGDFINLTFVLDFDLDKFGLAERLMLSKRVPAMLIEWLVGGTADQGGYAIPDPQDPRGTRPDRRRTQEQAPMSTIPLEQATTSDGSGHGIAFRDLALNGLALADGEVLTTYVGLTETVTLG